MALYKVNERGKPDAKARLVEAPSKEAALKHVASALFDIETISNAGETAKLMASGVKLETAGETETSDPAANAAGDNKDGAGEGQEKA